MNAVQKIEHSDLTLISVTNYFLRWYFDMKGQNPGFYLIEIKIIEAGDLYYGHAKYVLQ